MSRDRGSVTAETALALPVLVVVLAASVWVLAAVGAQLRCVDAAAGAARVAARGESPAVVSAAGRRLAPQDAVVRVEHRGEHVHVTVAARVQPFTVLGALPALQVDATAVALVEPGAAR
jgi:Flp pilus assembly protein TadG